MKRKLAYTGVAVSVALLSGCSQINKAFDNVGGGNYTDSENIKSMEVPPDLTAPEYDSTFVVNASNSSVSAEGLSRQKSSVGGGVLVLPDEGGLKIHGTGNQRYLEVAAPANVLWTRVTSFWGASGATLKRNEPAVGIMETDWIEYQEQMPQSRITGLFRGVFKKGIDSGYRDRYIVRFEKASAQSTRVFIAHRGAELMTSDTGNKWEAVPSNQEKSAEMLNRLKDYLRTGKSEEVYVSRDKPNTPAEKKKLFGIFNVGEPVDDEIVAKPKVSSSDSTLRLAGSPRNNYASVGTSLARTGFVIDGRDAAKGLYAARWAGQEEKKGLLDRINIFKKDKGSVLPAGSKYIIQVTGNGSSSVVNVLDEKGRVKSDMQAQAVLDVLRKDLAR